MKELSKYKLNKVSRNLDFFFDNASEEQVINGMQWYTDVHDEVVEISNEYQIERYKVAQVISALSPRNKWEQNMKDAVKVCSAFKHDLGPEDVKVCTFNNNKFKAFNILNGNVSITDRSLKTFNFVHNIAFLDQDALTIDVWHLRACFNHMIKIDNSNIGRKAYGQIKDLTIKKAKILGLDGFQYQAIIWLSAQSYFNPK